MDEKRELYRVRKSWEDEDTQTGVFGLLENAIKNCDRAGTGYYVFDADGDIVYPEAPYEEEPEEEAIEEVEQWHAGDVGSLKQGAKFVSGAAIPPWMFRTKIFVKAVSSAGNLSIMTAPKGKVVGIISGDDLDEFDPDTVCIPKTGDTRVLEKEKLEVGDQVQVRRGAKYTNGKPVPTSVLETHMFIRAFGADDTAIISRVSSGPLNGIVKVEDLSGYVEIPNSLGKVKIKNPGASLRINPGTNFAIIDHVKANEIFDVVEVWEQWGLIANRGWVYMPYVQRV